MNQQTLFGKKVISSINYNEEEIINDILHLHCKSNRIDLDPCYSAGNFYNGGIRQPIQKFDKFPQTNDTIEAESHNLPIEDSCIDTIIFDPPFVIDGSSYNETKNGSCIISKRFTSFNSWSELKEMYSKSLIEFYRLLNDKGIVIFKCQDIVSSGKNHITHSWIISNAIENGFYPKDLFILLAKNRLIDGRKQQHARKFHSYYLVFQKTKCKVDYSI